MCYFLFPCEKRSFTGGSNPAGIRAKAHIVIPTPSRRAFPLGLAAKHISYSTHSAREKARAEFLCFLAINYALIRAPSALRVPFQRCIVDIDICLAPTTLGSSCFAGEGISCGATEEGPEQMLLVEDRSSEGRSSLAPPPPRECWRVPLGATPDEERVVAGAGISYTEEKKERGWKDARTRYQHAIYDPCLWSVRSFTQHHHANPANTFARCISPRTNVGREE